MAAAAIVFGVGSAPARAVIPAPPSQWYGLPGLNAASGAQWARAFAYSAPPNVVYAGLEGGGVFRSTDGGATWSAFNSGFPNPLTTNVRALLTSSTGTTVWAGTDSGVWRSAGGAWAPVAQGPEDTPADPKKLNGSVQSLISLPGNIMLAGVASGGVYRSTDGGETWKPPTANNGMPSSQTPYGFVGEPPQAPAFVLVATSNGLFRSTDNGVTWSLAGDGIPTSASPIQPWVDSSKPNIIYVSTASNGIYRSINGGLTYAAINDGLGAVRARGFQIFTASQGAHLYAATEEGLWEAVNTHAAAPPPPKWKAVTQQGLHTVNPTTHNVIMWALTAPVIPGSGALGLIAGTQSNGGYFLSFQPPDSTCPEPPDATASCPKVTGTVQGGKTLTATHGTWTGTATIEYEYQWQRCTSTATGSCSDIAGETETTHLITKDDGTSGSRFRVTVTATNPAPTFGLYRRHSVITAAATPSPAGAPGYNQTSAPSISVQSPGQTTSPQIGDTMYAEYGLAPSATTDGWFNPKATSWAYRWLRCNGSGAACEEIPGATARQYTLVTADGTHDLRVRVTGTNASGTTPTTSSASYDVTSERATPIEAPSLFGTAWPGETLAGSVGSWKDPTTVFDRRWVRCDADGTACTYIQQVASTDPEIGPTYVIRDGDLGYTIRMRVTADVNGDTLHNQQPAPFEIDTPPSAVVAPKPVGGGGGGGGAGGGPNPGGGAGDTTAPVVSGFGVTNKTFAVAAGKTAVSARKHPRGTTFRFTLSETGTARIVIARKLPGRRVGKACKKPTRKLRKKKRCTRYVKAATLTRRNVAAGKVSVKFTGRIGAKKLARGPYRATIRVTDAAGNASKSASATFRVVRR